jgi:glutamate/tyrosine decarboxylase-like PLP-dependent enzyme
MKTMSARNMSAWFLGPKAENADWERKMISHILEDYFHWRRNYFPADEILVTEHMRREQLDFHDRLAQQLDEMLAGLRAHFPFYSPRYNAHMLSDQTIPSVLGYFAGLLYNPNNVTPESAPVTLRWELEVGADILKIVGFTPPSPPGTFTKQEFGWAHITSGGTIANIEALWLARNVRYFPLAARDVCRRREIHLTIKLPNDPDHPLPIADVSPEACLSLRPNQAIYLFGRLIDAVRRRWDLPQTEAICTATELLSESEYSIPHHGTRAAYNVKPPILLVSSARHYSLEKAADILGVGRERLETVETDTLFRMNIEALEGQLRGALSQGLLPMAVIAVAGTTEEGAVDPIHQIAALRERLAGELGESFWLHIDAAWGGYIRSLFVDADQIPVSEFVSREWTLQQGRYSKHLSLHWGSPEVLAAFESFPQAESVAVDPHKMGYVPYACGAVAFKNDLVRQFANREIAYISSSHLEDVDLRHHQAPDTIGPYILEGSKPGASVAACWLSHRLIPPNRSGYGEIVRASLLAARELHERLVHWDTAARTNGTEHPWRFVLISPQPPDTNIVCFLVQERPVRDLETTNAINRRIFEAFTIGPRPGAPVYSYLQRFFLSRTIFEPSHYPSASIAALLQRAEIKPSAYGQHGLFVLRATVMSPYHVLASETGHKQALLAEFVECLAAEATETVLSRDRDGAAT